MLHNGETMTRARSNRRSHDAGGAGRTPPPASGRSIRTLSLLLLVGVVAIVALLMLVSLLDFILKPDPAVRAGPMYVTLALTTGASLLMLLVALNATYLPVMSRRQVPNFVLVMGAMGVTGVVTGILAIGSAATPYVTRLVLASMAFTFIMIQDARLTKARAAATGRNADPPAPRQQPRPRTRQRRGGRKH